jgi:YHS domain-containing protein
MTTGGNPMKKLSLSLTAVTAIWFFSLISCSAPTAPINVGADGVALKGYDPVAYFTQGQPVKGQDKYQLEWNNAKWLFASSEHLALFQDDPAKYAPQYGGY